MLGHRQHRFLTNQRKLVSDDLVGRTDHQFGKGFAHPGAVTATIQGHYAPATITARHSLLLQHEVYAQRSAITGSFS